MGFMVLDACFQVTLTFRRNSERLVSSAAGASFLVNMQNLQLAVEYLRLQPASLTSLQNRLSRGPLHYQFLQTKLVGPLNLVRGVREETLTVSRGSVAELAIVCLQRENRNSADYRTTYQDFAPNGLSFAMVNIHPMRPVL